ncbi:MAG: DUF484 family protein [Nitrosomonadales bacterium]|nr:DUF484 family protein [Nitrosomonadales bacterium]
MQAEDVAQFLRDNPQFFENHAALLAEITIPHPHGGRTISLSERQMLTLREKNKLLEKKLHELIEIARDNDALQNKLHTFIVTLFESHDLMSFQEAVKHNLREIFAIPHAVLHTWKGVPPSAEVLGFADQQATPVCAHHAVHETGEWFGEVAPQLRSYAYLPLRDGNQSTGLLVLASEDVQRFYPEMGTIYLQRIADAVSAALRPHL